MVEHRRFLWTRSLYVALAAILFGQCGPDDRVPTDSYSATPRYERSVTVTHGGDTLQPVQLHMIGDTLYVSYVRRSQIDVFSRDVEQIRTIPLLDPEPVYPTSFVVTDSSIIVSDHAKQAIVVYDRNGGFQTSFGLLPDEVTRVSPLAVTFYGGVLYAADIALRQVLAISMANAPGITEPGELILSIPHDTAFALGFPSALLVTPDGRLLIGDAGNGLVRVFTCDGRAVYTFDTLSTNLVPAPLAFAIDDIVDPALQDTSSFDPSGIRDLGRIHLVDGNNSAVHMFNPLGRFIATYPPDSMLGRPSDIAIDRQENRLYLADPQAKKILVFRYQD